MGREKTCILIFSLVFIIFFSFFAIGQTIEKQATYFMSNGDHIAGWYWLRDSSLQHYAEWTFENIPPGNEDLTLDITALATDRPGGGSGFDARFTLIYGFPGSGNMGGLFKKKTVFISNISAPKDPLGYHCQGQISVDRGFIPAASSILIRVERESSNDNHVAFNQESMILLVDNTGNIERKDDLEETKEKQISKGDQLPEADEIEEAKLIQSGTYFGSLGEEHEGHRDNTDYYRIDVEEGQLITLKLSVPGNANYYLALLNPNRNSRGSAVNEEEAKILEYVADSTGTWYIRINRSSGEGEYQLSFDIQNQNDAGSGKDAGKTPEEMIKLLPSTITGFLKAGDNEDYYSFEVTKGQLITLQLSVPGNANYYLALLNPNRNSRGSAVTKENIKTLDYVADSTGTWYIRINRSSGEGEYELTVNIEDQNDAASGQDAGDSYQEAISISPGSAIGFLKAGDNSDFYSIKVEEGQLITLKLSIPGNASYHLALLNPNRNSRGSAVNEEGAKILDYVADSTGTWYIRINRSSGEGEYQLVVDIPAGEADEETLATVERQDSVKEDEGAISRQRRDEEVSEEQGNLPPVALFEYPAFAVAGEEVFFDASSSYDPDGEIKSYQWEIRKDGKTLEKFNEEKMLYNFSDTGTYEIFLTAIDDQGAEDVKIFTINIISPTDSPVARFSCNLAIGEENNFLFDGSDSYGPSIIEEYEWDFGDGSRPIKGKQVEHKFDSPGTYRVTLTVVDQNGERAKETKEIDTTVLLTASFTFSPGEPGLSERVNFDASLSQSLRTIEVYQWDFGDGSEEAYGINVEHSFAATGVYEVELTIIDESGEISTAIKEITVLAIDENAFIQCGVIHANNEQRIPFRAAFQEQPIVVTSAMIEDTNVVISTPINITNSFFDVAINDFQGNPVSNALMHWIAFLPDSTNRCLGGVVNNDGQTNVYISFPEILNVRENEQIIVITNAEKNRAFLSRTGQIDEQGAQIWVTDQDSNPVSADIYWMAVVPNDQNGFQGSHVTVNHGDSIIFENTFSNQAACVCTSSSQGVIAAASNSSQNQFIMNLSASQANVNWLAYGGAVPPLQNGQIRVSSTPGGATVYLNGSEAGTTPLDDALEISDLSPGEYDIKLELQDYGIFETTVTVNPSETVIVNPTLHTNPGTILVSSDPDGATIKIDNSTNYPFYWDNEQGWENPEYGETQDGPIELTPIPPGEHTLTLELENYAIWSGTYDLEPGGTWIVNAILESEPGSISVTSNQPGAQIYLAEGEWVEQPDSEEIEWIEKGTIPSADIYGTAVPLVLDNIAAGIYTVKCSSNYYQEMVQAIQVNSNLTTELHFELVPALAYVEINAQDELGKPISSADNSFLPRFGQVHTLGLTDEYGISEGDLNAGTYTLRVWKTNYFDFTEEIDLTSSYDLENPFVINAILEGKPGSINVTSSPSGATVYISEGDQTNNIDNSVIWEEQGITPLTISGVTQGTYTIKMFLESYIPSDFSSDVTVPVEGYPFIEKVTVNPGQTNYITANLTQITGHIIISSNEEEVNVFIDSVAKGPLWNMPVGGYQVPTGIHNVQVTKDNFISYQTSVQVGYQETITVDANLYQAQSLTALIDMTPSYGQPPLEVNFTGEGIGPAGTDILSYEWDFGDDNFSSEQNPIHTYQQAGQYNVILTVTDQNDNTASKDVFVNVLSGDQIIVTPASGCLIISSDSAMIDPGSITYSGNLLLNGFLGVTGSVTVQDGENGQITGVGNLVTGDGTIDTGIATINNGAAFTIEPKASDVGGCFRTLSGNFTEFSFPFHGLELTVSDPKLYENRLSLNGSLSPFWGALPAISISPSISASGFDFGGRIELPNFKIGSFGVKDAFLELDVGCGTCWGAGITFGLPPGVGIEVGGELGIQEGSIDRVLASAGDLGAPIGNTGVFLDSINGGLEHIPPDIDPLILKAGAGFYAGPKIPPVGAMPSFQLAGITFGGGDFNLLGGNVDLIFDCSGKMTAEGTAYILAPNFGEIGSAELTVDLNRGFYAWGELRYPPGDFAILKGNLAGKLDFDLEFQGSVAGTLQVPEILPIIGGMNFGQAAGYIDNDLIAAGVKIGDRVCVPIAGCYDFTIPVCLIFSFDDPGFEVVTNWDAIQEVSLTGLPYEYAPVQYAGISIPMFSLAQADRNPTIEQVFEVPEDLEVAIFHMNISDEGIPPEFAVISPDGMIYEQGRETALWRGNEATSDLWCAVSNPPPGRWVVTSDMFLSDLEYKVILYKLNQVPMMELTTPVNEIIVEKGTQIPITWRAEDPDSDAMIRLCYSESPLQQMDNQQPAFPGNTIVKNLSEDNSKNTFVWNTQGVAPGQYHIYAVIFDGKNFPVYAWSKGSVIILDSKFPPPKGVKAYQDGEGIKIEWSNMPGADGYHVYYQEAHDKTPLNLTSSLAIWKETKA